MNRHSTSFEIRHRRGFTLTEAIVAASLLGTLFLVTIPLVSHVRIVRQEADLRAIAQQEAANIMEQVAALAIRGTLSADAVQQLSLTSAADRLPDASLDVKLADATEPLSGQQVTVAIGWTHNVNASALPAVLSAWFPPGEDD